jgi:hypothetical protein
MNTLLVSGVMNSQKLARATFVIARETHDQLRYISGRMGVSRSDLVRDFMAEPVALMAKWVRSLPDQPTSEDVAASSELLQLDMLEFLTEKAPDIGLKVTP